VILSALPTAVGSYLITANSGIGAGVCSTMIFWTNIFFLPAVVCWLLVLDALGIFTDGQ
jgi:predicted permease